ncbi:hypothetical protein J0H58_10030 [bacterium]|nr:hypothetical protein [bacterium]
MARAVLLAALVAALTGCHLLTAFRARRTPPPAEPTFSEYHLTGWQWEGVSRVLVLPALNESPYTRAGTEVRDALTSALQRLGRFEVVAAPPDDRAVLAAVVHRGGAFDEGLMLELARTFRADVIVHPTVTHSSPYPRPRLGLILQAVAPGEGKVIASVDGLWDTSDPVVAERVRAYYRPGPAPHPVRARNHVIATDDGFAGELALESPALFQRFVAYEAGNVLLGLPLPGVVTGAGVACDP